MSEDPVPLCGLELFVIGLTSGDRSQDSPGRSGRWDRPWSNRGLGGMLRRLRGQHTCLRFKGPSHLVDMFLQELALFFGGLTSGDHPQDSLELRVGVGAGIQHG
jgi:hypothetical protein